MNDEVNPLTPPPATAAPAQPAEEVLTLESAEPDTQQTIPGSLPPTQAPAFDFAPPAAASVIPPGGVLYKVDSSRASFGELWRDSSPATAWLAWLTKLMRVRLPGSVNDPNVDTLTPFEIAPGSLPVDVRERMASQVQHLAAVGFDVQHPICHAIVDLFNNSRTYIVSLPRADGRAVGRVFLRTEGNKVPPKQHLYCDLLTELGDGTFLWSTAAKATLRAPAGCRVRQDVGASPAELWSGHQRAIEQAASTVRPAVGREKVVDLIERHHALLRELHLRRKLFTRLSAVDRDNASAIESSYGHAATSGFVHPEVFAEMQRLQNKKSGWVGGVLILVVSLLFFIGAGLGGDRDQPAEVRSMSALALLVPILFVHELGHYLAMRVFGYRNLRMFFIPFFGAAVSGQNYSAPGWKKVIVSLMGPLPGILLGAGLGIAGIVLHNALFMKVALMALILNGFNLLPVLPLDGGRVVQTLFFSRHYALDVAFRALAAVALLGMSLMNGGRFFLYIGIAMLLGIPLALRGARLAATLRREGFRPPESQSHEIPPAVADVIITRVKAGFPKAVATNNKAVAQQALTVYENLCNRPPGWAATVGFTFLHGGAFVMALVVSAFLIIEQGGGLARFARGAFPEPKHTLTLADIDVARGPRPAVASTQPVGTLVANLSSPKAARAAFDSLRPRIEAGQSFGRFGQTLLLTFPREDAAARRRWFGELESFTKELAVENDDLSAPLVIACTAPSAAAAEEIEREAREYFRVPGPLNLITPWAPDDTRTPEERQRHRVARATYLRLTEAGNGGYDDPRVQALSRPIADARRRGDREEVDALAQKQSHLAGEVRRARLQAIRDVTDDSVDHEVVTAYFSLPWVRLDGDGLEDDVDELDSPYPALDLSVPAYRTMALRMGMARTPPLPPLRPATAPTTRGAARAWAERRAPRINDYGAHYGSVVRTGTRLQFHLTSLSNPVEGAPAVVQWLDRRKCTKLKYEFQIARETLEAAEP